MLSMLISSIKPILLLSSTCFNPPSKSLTSFSSLTISFLASLIASSLPSLRSFNSVNKSLSCSDVKKSSSSNLDILSLILDILS
nr:MAG TPA: hypothetical protein [Caudoviricetes sp.]